MGLAIGSNHSVSLRESELFLALKAGFFLFAELDASHRMLFMLL